MTEIENMVSVYVSAKSAVLEGKLKRRFPAKSSCHLYVMMGRLSLARW